MIDPPQPRLIARLAPTAMFYRRFIADVYRSSRTAAAGRYGDAQWVQTSLGVMNALQNVGVSFHIGGRQHLSNLEGPAVIIGNHASMLETMVLPGIVQPILDVTFVVKQSLLDYPLFKHIMRTRDPIAVGRDNPREDFKTVMSGGTDRLKRGISVIVFPQTTRTATFDPSQFNSIGAKLAAKADVPIIPLALKTDAWSNGRYIKDLGPIRPDRPVHFEFGPPITAAGRAKEANAEVIAFIESNLKIWQTSAN